MSAPDVEYIAAFEGHEGYVAEALVLGPDGRVYIADPTFIYRLEKDGTTSLVVGRPQQTSLRQSPSFVAQVRNNTLQDSVGALEARIVPGAMAFDEEGRLYFVDHINGEGARIARLEHNGTVVTFAGTGESGFGGDGGPAREARFRFRIGSVLRSSLVFDSQGRLLVLDSGNGRIRQIDRQGVVTTVLDTTAVDADGIPVWSLGGELLLDADMNLYFAGSYRIFRRRPDGVVEGVAGTGERGFSGDGGPALQAQLSWVGGMAFDPDGALYFSDGGNQRIRRITSGGLVETVAGHGVNPPDYSPVSTACMGSWATAESCRVAQGDGGPSLEATLWWPLRLLISQDGDLFVAMTSAITSGFWQAGHFSQLRRIYRIDRYHPNSPTAIEEEVPRIRQPVSVGDEPFLLQVYPNPVNPSTQIRFAFPEQTVVWAEVWDVLGRPVRRLVEGEVFAAGEHRLRWEGHDGSGGRVGSGVYVVRVRAGERAQAVKVVVVR